MEADFFFAICGWASSLATAAPLTALEGSRAILFQALRLPDGFSPKYIIENRQSVAERLDAILEGDPKSEDWKECFLAIVELEVKETEMWELRMKNPSDGLRDALIREITGDPLTDGDIRLLAIDGSDHKSVELDAMTLSRQQIKRRIETMLRQWNFLDIDAFWHALAQHAGSKTHVAAFAKIPSRQRTQHAGDQVSCGQVLSSPGGSADIHPKQYGRTMNTRGTEL